MSSNEERAAREVGDDMALRWGLQQALGEDRPGGQDTYSTFNYDRNPDIDDYYASFLRSRYGGPVVTIPAETAWRDPPDIEDEQDTDSETDTPFESELASLVNDHRLWNYGKRADTLAGIGEFGVLVLELDDIDGPDGFKQPADNASELTGLRPFSQKSVESLATGGPGSGRWGEPVGYRLDLSDEDDTEDETPAAIFSDESGDATGPDEMWVHHSRVIHIPSDGLLDDEVRGQPRQEGCWNTLTDIEKTMGSAAELAYRASAWGLALNVAKDFNVQDGGDDLRENVRRWYHGLEPILRTQGMEDIQNLGGADIDPAPIVDPNIEALAARTGIPQKVLKGNESGEVAGSQDLREFYGKIQERREQFVTPHIVRALVQRLIDLGVLDAPSGGDFAVEWSPLAQEDEQEQSEIQYNRARSANQLQTVMPSMDSADWKVWMEDGEFPDDMGEPGIEPMNPAEDAGAPPVDMADAPQQPALPDGGNEESDGE